MSILTPEELDAMEADELAWERARRQQGPEVVRAGYRAADYAMPADPTDILGADEPEPVLDGIRVLEVNWFRPGDAVVVNGLRFVIDSISAQWDVLTMSVRAFADVVKLAEDVLDRAFDEPDTNRRRHGSAAMCPIHGVTKGGLCRACARGKR